MKLRSPDINVTGTSSGAEKQVVVDLECSANCTDITAVGTHITPPSGSAAYVCKNISSTNQVGLPSSCYARGRVTHIGLQLDFPCTAPGS
jgi:hypothetical protein